MKRCWVCGKVNDHDIRYWVIEDCGRLANAVFEANYPIGYFKKLQLKFLVGKHPRDWRIKFAEKYFGIKRNILICPDCREAYTAATLYPV